MAEAAFKYDFGVNKLVYEPGLSIKEVCKKDIFSNLFKLQILHLTESMLQNILKTLI